MNITKCPDCNGVLSASASSCRTCGHIPDKVRFRRNCYTAIAISWAVSTTNTSSLFGIAFADLVQGGALFTLNLFILILLWHVTYMSAVDIVRKVKSRFEDNVDARPKAD